MSFKHTDILKDDLVSIPIKLLTMSISSSAKIVYMYLLTTNKRDTRRSTIAAGTFLNKNTITKALTELNDTGMITSIRSTTGEKYTHKVNRDFDWNNSSYKVYAIQDLDKNIVYIGQTNQSLKSRFHGHTQTRNLNMNEYSIALIQDGLSKQAAIKIESELIMHHNTIEFGWNKKA